MTTTKDLTPRDLAAAETERFVLDALPRGRMRVLDVGAGDGLLAARLARRGHEVTAIERDEDFATAARARGVSIVAADFLDWSGGTFDAVVLSRVLHHLRPLDAALERARAALAPGAVLVIEDFAHERVDRDTAAWLDGRARAHRDDGLLTEPEPAVLVPAAPGLPPSVDDALERWRRHAAEHEIHSGAELVRAVTLHFEPLRVENVAYLYRYLCAALEPSSRGAAAARALIADEERAIAANAIRAVGLRLVARAPRSG